MRGSILKRFAIAALVALALTSVTSLILSYIYSSREALGYGAESSATAAEITRALFSSEDFNSMPSPESEEYQAMELELEWVCKLAQLEYLSIYKADSQRTVRTYLLIAASDEQDRESLGMEYRYGGTSNEPFSEDELKALDGIQPDNTPHQINDQFGSTYAWFFPLKMYTTGDHYVIRAEVDVRSIANSTNDNALAFAIPMIAALILTIGIGLYMLNRNIVQPLRVVSSRMHTFLADSMSNEAPLALGRDDEIGEIADSFNQMTDNIKRYVTRIEEMTEERVASATELQVARRIQLGLVPETLSKSGPGYEGFAFFRAAREVGGDFYDLFTREDGHVCLVMADVSGKGVSAALFMSMARTLLHEKLVSLPPAQALNEANDAILQHNPEGMFVTVCAGVYNPATRELRFANAGHTRPYVIGRGYLTPDPGIALGIFEDAGIVEERITLMPGEGVLLYTDGATEAVNGANEFYGEERLGQAVADTKSAETAVLSLKESIDAFVTGREQFDDLTLLSLFAQSGDVWRWALEPETSSFATLRVGLLELCGTTSPVKRALLALDEAFANVVNYAGATRVDVWAFREEAVLTVKLVDDGVAFDPLAYTASEREFDEFDEGGMGISLIKQTADQLAYERANNRNILTMTFDLSEG